MTNCSFLGELLTNKQTCICILPDRFNHGK